MENNENILPGHHTNSREALAKHGPPKGESRNPAGRPKGSRNIRTILDEMLHRYVDVEALKHLKGIDATVELCKQLGVPGASAGKCTGSALAQNISLWPMHVAAKTA